MKSVKELLNYGHKLIEFEEIGYIYISRVKT